MCLCDPRMANFPILSSTALTPDPHERPEIVRRSELGRMGGCTGGGDRER